MKKTILLAATLATVAFGAARAAETPSTDAQKPPVPMAAESVKPMVTAANEPIAMQRPGDRLTSKIVGQNVYSKSGEKIGDVNDLLVDATGKVNGVVVGVGGFLGVGEKNVALPWNAVTMGTDEKGAPRLTVDVTKDALHKAPTFEPAKG